MKQLGVEQLVSVSSAGSMKEESAPGDLVVADQFIDHTYKRPADILRRRHRRSRLAGRSGVRGSRARPGRGGRRRRARRFIDGGTYLCIEGPQFSTRAESNLYRSWGVDVISMTAMQEARLAREAELCYAVLALVTDYDCWHRERRGGRYRRDSARDAAQRRACADTRWRIWRGGSPTRTRNCACAHALKDAIITDRAVIPPKVAAELRPIIGKYLQ